MSKENFLILTLLLLIGPCNAFLVGPANTVRHASRQSVLFQTHEEIEDFQRSIKNGEKGPDGVIDVVMKFGGSSLADASRVDHVANLIKDQIKAGYRPRSVVCSAMGKTTNALLSAGDFALGML